MTRSQDGGGNREEGLESWSLGTLSEGPQLSVHAARVPSRSAWVLLRLCFHRAQPSSLGDIMVRQYRLCHVEGSLVGTESCFVLVLPSVCPVPSEVTNLQTRDSSEHPKGNSPQQAADRQQKLQEHLALCWTLYCLAGPPHFHPFIREHFCHLTKLVSSSERPCLKEECGEQQRKTADIHCQLLHVCAPQHAHTREHVYPTHVFIHKDIALNCYFFMFI